MRNLKREECNPSFYDMIDFIFTFVNDVAIGHQVDHFYRSNHAFFLVLNISIDQILREILNSRSDIHGRNISCSLHGTLPRRMA